LIKKWKILEETIYKHLPYRRIKDTIFEMPDGRIQTFSLKKEGTCVCILPITENGKVVLARQYRPGPDEVLDELPGGGPEKGESHIAAAKRELLEETGYEPTEIISLGMAHECGYSTVIREGFLALGCKKISEPTLDQNEFIEPIEKSIDDFIEQLLQGKCTDPEFGWMGLYKMGIIKKT
jgi:ADP-ribose pyrophosphatase